MPSRTSTNDVTKLNKDALFNLASDDELWRGYLDVMAAHTGRDRRRTVDGSYESLDNLSALNCAAVAIALEGEDSREVMTAREWRKLYPDAQPAEGSSGIPIVKASSTGKNVWVDLAFPASAMDGLPEQRYHNLTGKVDLKDDVDAACWHDAISDLSVYRDRVGEDGKRVFEDGRAVRDAVKVSFDELSGDLCYVVCKHFGMDVPEGAPSPAAPVASGVVDTADALKAYCDQIKSDAAALTGQISRAFSKARRELMGVDLDEPAQVAQAETVAQAQAQEGPAPDQPSVVEPYSPIGRTPAENARAATFSAVHGQEHGSQQQSPSQLI